MIGINESGIKKDKSAINRINLKGYSPESCPAESAAGDILVFISNNLSEKLWNDLRISNSTRLESTFNKVLSLKRNKCECGLHLLPSSYELAWI